MPIGWSSYLIVAVGGALGSALRYAASVLFGSAPSTTFAVNILGSFLVGFLAATLVDPRIRLLVGPGFLGGFTTFSAWQLEALYAMRSENGAKAALWILVGSLLTGFAACSLGYYLGERLRL